MKKEILEELVKQVHHMSITRQMYILHILSFTINNTINVYIKEKKLDIQSVYNLDKQIKLYLYDHKLELNKELLDYIGYLNELMKTHHVSIYLQNFIPKTNFNPKYLLCYDKTKKCIFVLDETRRTYDINEIRNISKNSVIDKQYNLLIDVNSFFKSTDFNDLYQIRKFIMSYESDEMINFLK